MGYGLPAAIAASVERPGTPVVCLAGDGCFQMTGNELATAVQAGATPLVLVCDNGRYGTIRMHQENHYPGRVSGTDLVNPDFAALARAHGAHAETVGRDDDFAAALDRALDSGRLALLHLRLDPRTLSTGRDLG
jgi:acetolactate synthase-1/2/3 large subunit